MKKVFSRYELSRALGYALDIEGEILCRQGKCPYTCYTFSASGCYDAVCDVFIDINNDDLDESCDLDRRFEQLLLVAARYCGAIDKSGFPEVVRDISNAHQRKYLVEKVYEGLWSIPEIKWHRSHN